MPTKKNGRKPIERLAKEHYSWWGNTFVFIKKNELKIWQGVFLIAFLTGMMVTMVLTISLGIHSYSSAADNGSISKKDKEQPKTSSTLPDLSFLAPAQVKELADLYGKKQKKEKQNISASKEVADLEAALKKYKVPDSVLTELDSINSLGLAWTANFNDILIKPEKYKKNLLGVKPDGKILKKLSSQSQNSSPSTVTLPPAKTLSDNYDNSSLPASFDWRNVGGKNYLTSIKDQGDCGSCWAFAAVAVLEGNINAYFNDPAVNQDLSEQDLVSCYLPGSCETGAYSNQIEQIFNDYLPNIGITQETCLPYSASDQACSLKCSEWPSQIWKTNNSYQSIAPTIDNIKSAVVNYGPVEVGMVVYLDLFYYTEGIYFHTSNTVAGYHAVTIVGYGAEDGVPYWIVKNSWGTGWGENGYFRIAMGDSMIDQWFGYTPGVPYYNTANIKLCTDADNDGYCYWGLGAKPGSGCDLSCAENGTEDCDDANASINTGCGALTQQTGILKVTSTPSEAKVYVQDVSNGNWIYRGQTPASFNLNTGSRNVKITKIDYLDKIVSTSLINGQEASLNVTLLPEPKIANPLSNDILRIGDVINITGSSGEIDNGSSFKIEWSKDSGQTWSSEGIVLSNNGVQKVNNGTLGQWDTSFITRPNYYTLRLVSIIGEAEYTKLADKIYLDSTLARGWPQRIPYYYGPSSFDMNYKSRPLAFTTAKYYSLVENSSEKGGPQIKTLTNTNKNSLGLYTVDLNLPLSSNVYYFAGNLEPMVADLNGDGKKEIIVYKGGGKYPQLYVYNQDGSILWEKDFTGYTGPDGNVSSIQPMPIAGDINGDGKNEIIVYAINYEFGATSALYALKNDGSVLWMASIPTDYQPTILMADLKGDGKKEIVIKGNGGSPNPVMSVVDNEGNLISHWDLPSSHCGASIMPSPAVGHFDNSKKLQIVYVNPSPNCDWTTTTDEAVMYVFNEDGSVLPGWPIYLPGSIPSSPVVGDINKDGKDEIILGLTYLFHTFPDNNFGGVYAIDRNGKILPGWPVQKGWNFWSTPALGDVDGDGYLEISASRLGFNTYLFRYNGSLVSGWPQTTSWNDYYGSIIGDVNSDGKLDILTTAGNGFYPVFGNGGVYAWNKDGSTIIGFPKITEEDAQAPAVLSDIDNDGKTELIASSDLDHNFIDSTYKGRGSIYVWETNKTYNQTSMSWPMFMHDTEHTGCYDCVAPSATTLSGLSSGWLNKYDKPTMTLTASGNGVRNIIYEITPDPRIPNPSSSVSIIPGTGSYTYTAISPTSFTFFNPGVYKINYYAIDNLGNQEPAKSQMIKIYADTAVMFSPSVNFSSASNTLVFKTKAATPYKANNLTYGLLSVKLNLRPGKPGPNLSTPNIGETTISGYGWVYYTQTQGAEDVYTFNVPNTALGPYNYAVINFSAQYQGGINKGCAESYYVIFNPELNTGRRYKRGEEMKVIK